MDVYLLVKGNNSFSATDKQTGEILAGYLSQLDA